MSKIRMAALAIGVVTYIGCSDVAFKAAPSATCSELRGAYGADACVQTEDGYNTYKYTARVGDVDILFVDDNSHSMYEDQTEMANRFPGFLDSIKSLNYQIAITTTDVSASPNNPPDAYNGNGAYQDGKLLVFPNGKKILSNPNVDEAIHQQNISHFQNTIKRPESYNCDPRTTCPSGDERGIYALNLALDRSDNSALFRAGGHLAVVILSDEDERTNGGSIPGYSLENYDLPETFVGKAKNQLDPTKMVSVHSIIIRPGDSTCYNQQYISSTLHGSYGTYYAQLSNPSSTLQQMGNLIPGVTGSICSSNYTTEMGSIASKIKQTLGTIQLLCNPVAGSLSVSFTPAQSISYSVDSNNRLNLSPAAPAGTKVNLEYKCSRN